MEAKIRRKLTSYPYAEELLRDWGVCIAKAVDGLGYASISPVQKLIELGTRPDGTALPIKPNYFPSGETIRAQKVHEIIIELPRVKRNVLEARYVLDLNKYEGGARLKISPSQFMSQINESLAWITGKLGRIPEG